MATIVVTVSAGQLTQADKIRLALNKQTARSVNLPDTATEAQVIAAGLVNGRIFSTVEEMVLWVLLAFAKDKGQLLKVDDLDDFRLRWAALTPAQRNPVLVLMGLPAGTLVPPP